MTAPEPSNKAAMALRVYAGLTAILCWVGLGLQFELVIAEATRLGAGPAMAVTAYLLFFTIQTVFLATLIMTLTAVGARPDLISARFKSAVMVYVGIAGLIFFVVLRPVWHHTGAQALADALLHYGVPTLYGLFWLVAVPKGALRWRDPLIWMIYPFCYFVAMMAFGLATGYFPYPFFDVPTVGIAAVAVSAAGLFVAFLAAGFALVAVGRRVGTFGISETR